MKKIEEGNINGNGNVPEIGCHYDIGNDGSGILLGVIFLVSSSFLSTGDYNNIGYW